MLQVKSMSFCNFTVHCLFYPIYWIHYFVSPFPFHCIYSPLKLCVNDPHKQKTFFLELLNWNFFNQFIAQTIILNCDSSWWLRTRQPPWRIHHQDVKLSIGNFKLLKNQFIEIELGDIGTYRNCKITDLGCFIYKRCLLIEEGIFEVSDFGVDLNEEVLELGFIKRQFIEDKIVIEDVFEIGGIVRMIFRIFLNFFSARRLIFINIRRINWIIFVKLLIIGYFFLGIQKLQFFDFLFHRRQIKFVKTYYKVDFLNLIFSYKISTRWKNNSTESNINDSNEKI